MKNQTPRIEVAMQSGQLQIACYMIFPQEFPFTRVVSSFN